MVRIACFRFRHEERNESGPLRVHLHQSVGRPSSALSLRSSSAERTSKMGQDAGVCPCCSDTGRVCAVGARWRIALIRERQFLVVLRVETGLCELRIFMISSAGPCVRGLSGDRPGQEISPSLRRAAHWLHLDRFSGLPNGTGFAALCWDCGSTPHCAG